MSLETSQSQSRSNYPTTRAGEDLHPGKDLIDYAKAYAQEKPEVVAMWCLGVGFILGWKLKPW